MHYAWVRLSLRRIAPNLFDPPLSISPWSDARGALSGALVSIPLTLAYSLIIGAALGGSSSGIALLMGLYGSVVVGLLAVLLGGCPFLVAAPRAATLLVIAALIGQLVHSAALADVANPVPLALALACVAVFLAGVLRLLFGIFRLGWLANYVPFPVLAGFMNGTALLIILSQVWPATGITAQKSIWALFNHLDEIKPASLMLATGTVAAAMLIPRLKKRLPTILLVFVGGTLIYHLLAALGYGPALGGTLSPPPENFTFNFIGTDAFALLSGPFGASLMLSILLAAVSMAILSTLDTMLTTTATDEITMRRSDVNRQLIAEGLGDALAGMFSLSPGSSGITRTQAAFNGGMTSAATPIGIALLTLVLTLALTPAIGMLSQAVMAGLLIAISIDLLDKWTRTQLRRLISRSKGPVAAKGDLFVVGIVTCTALLTDLVTAVGMGILLSLLLFVIHMARSPIRRCYSSIALIPHVYGDVARCKFLEQHGKHIVVIETDGALFFGTASELEKRVQALITDGVVHLVLDLRRIKYIDATGARLLERLNAKLTKNGGMLVVSHVDQERRQPHKEHYAVDDRRDRHRQSAARNNWSHLNRFGTIQAVGESRFKKDTDSAVALCEKHLVSQLADNITHPPVSQARSQLTHMLDRSILRRLRNYWTRMSYMPGEVIFTQGSHPDGVFFIASGRVEVLIDLPDTDRKRKVQSLTPGSIFGEMALLDRQPRSASIVTTDHTTCYWMSSDNFERLKVEQAPIAMALLTNVAMIFIQRLRATNTMLAEMEA